MTSETSSEGSPQTALLTPGDLAQPPDTGSSPPGNWVLAWSALRTLLTIAHRRQSIEWADFVLVISDGRLAECGAHAELLRAKGVYADLFEGGLPS